MHWTLSVCGMCRRCLCSNSSRLKLKKWYYIQPTFNRVLSLVLAGLSSLKPACKPSMSRLEDQLYLDKSSSGFFLEIVLQWFPTNWTVHQIQNNIKISEVCAHVPFIHRYYHSSYLLFCMKGQAELNAFWPTALMMLQRADGSFETLKASRVPVDRRRKLL